MVAFCAVLLVASLYQWGNIEVVFDMRLRDFLLLAFFSSIGLSAKLNMLRAGGKPLVFLLCLSVTLLVLQNLTGIAAALGLGSHPTYGLMAGSIPFAGGHGTAIAWGEIAEEAGLTGSNELGIACATFGLIAGGLIGGPIAGRLVERFRLDHSEANSRSLAEPGDDNDYWSASVRLAHSLASLLMLAMCITAGSHINDWLSDGGIPTA